MGAASAALLGVLVIGRRAYAADRVTFAWETPPGCPSSGSVEAAIVTRLGSARPATRVDVRGTVVREADGFRVRLSIGAHERTLLAPSCRHAAEAAAVIVAVAIEEAARASAAGDTTMPSSATEPATGDAPSPGKPASAEKPAVAAPTQTPPAPVGPAPAPAPVPRATPEATPETTPPFTRHFEIGLGAGIDTATLPEPSPGIALSASYRATRWLSLGIVASAFLPQTQQASGEPPVRADVLLVDAIARACVLAPLALGARALDLGGCLGAGVGLLPAESASISNPSSGVGVRPELWAAGHARLALTGRFGLHLDAGPLVDPSRPPFEVAGVGTVHRPAIVTFRGVLGVGIIFR